MNKMLLFILMMAITTPILISMNKEDKQNSDTILMVSADGVEVWNKDRLYGKPMCSQTNSHTGTKN